MFDIKPDEMFSKIHQYKLDRPEGWFYISVHEVVASVNAKIQFIAVPNLAVQQADNQYFGTGDSIDNALADCLGKIKQLSINNLFPHLEEAYSPDEEMKDTE